jgi:predicted PurR-regulated permease PerM
MTVPPNHTEHDEAPLQRVVQQRAISTAIIGTFVILLVGALYYAREFFLPLILASLLTLTFRPLARELHRRGIPGAAIAVLFVVVLAGAVIGAAFLIAQPLADLFSQAPTIAQKLRDRFSDLRQPLSTLSEAGKAFQDIANGEGTDTEQVVIAQPGIITWAADTLGGIGTTLGATLIFTIFLLASGDLFLLKLVRVVGSLSEAKRSLRIVHDVENEVSRYLLTITMINVGLGCLVGTAMAILGMPGPLAWGAVVALLNYIPYVGPFAGILSVAAVSLITFPTIGMALLPPAAYLILSLLEGAFVSPMVLGRRLELNSVAILVVLALAGWMWGIVGALIAVPLLVVVKVFCDHFPNLSTFGEFLSSQTPQPTTAQAAIIAEDEGKAPGDTPAPDSGRRAA